MKKTRLTKLIAGALVLASIIGVNPVGAYAAQTAAGKTGSTMTSMDTTPESDFTFDSSTGTITEYNGRDNIVNIPKTINGVTVKAIGYLAFGYHYNLSSVTIPDSVTKIDISAFAVCEGLTSVKLPSSLTTLGYGAFSACGSLQSITIDSSNNYFTSVNGVLFNKTKTKLIYYPVGNKSTSYTIPSTVTTIGADAFANSNLVSVTIPSSVTSIEDFAFYYCMKLNSVNIPNGVRTIGKNAFESNGKLTSVTLPASITSIGDYAFSDCGNANFYVKNATIKQLVINAGADSSKITIR